ncbi:hypothetical protein MPER_08710, partial [Moniliophthora perniciosa FA553]
ISGIGDPQTADAMDMNVLRSVFETNFFGLVQTITTLLPLIRKAKPGYGNIVQNSMRWASGEHQSSPQGITTFAAYCSSKSAVNMYSIALARELKKDRIRVNCLCPGFVTTKLNHFRPGGKTTEQGASLFPEWCLLGPGTEDKTGLFWDAAGQVPW